MKLTILVSCFVIAFGSASAQHYEDHQIYAFDGGAEDLFGDVVALCENIALVGARGDGDNGLYSGSAYVFRYIPATNTWDHEDKLLPSDGTAGDHFGCSVTVSGNIALVGAPLTDDNGVDSGSAYIFRYDSGSGKWLQEDELLPMDGTDNDHFGDRTSLFGEVALVSASGVDHYGIDSGAAYVFRYDSLSGTWKEEDKLLPADGTERDFFGSSVALFEDTALIGAYNDDENGTGAGSAYVFRYDPGSETWKEEGKLLPADGDINKFFGTSVSLWDDTALIGVVLDDDVASNSGSAYLFRYNPASGEWFEKDKLLASDSAEGDSLGVSVALSNDTALVGAYNDDDNGTDSGSAYIYEVAQPQPQTNIKANGSDGPLTLNYGTNLTVDISLDPGGELGVDGDWWLVVYSPFGWYRYGLLSGMWIPGQDVTYQGPLNPVSSMIVYNGSSLPVGSYLFRFGVDTVMNGSFDTGDAYHDLVYVTIQ